VSYFSLKGTVHIATFLCYFVFCYFTITINVVGVIMQLTTTRKPIPPSTTLIAMPQLILELVNAKIKGELSRKMVT
jgi:hypothetical protein